MLIVRLSREDTVGGYENNHKYIYKMILITLEKWIFATIHITMREHRIYELYLYEITRGDKGNKCGYRVSVHNGIISPITFNTTAISNDNDYGYIKIVSFFVCSHKQFTSYNDTDNSNNPDDNRNNNSDNICSQG